MNDKIKLIDKIIDENKQEAIDLLVEAIQTPSLSRQEIEISKVFTKWIEKIGLEVQTYSLEPNCPSLISEWKGNESGPTFLFNGHYDVFPPGKNWNGKYGPWSGHIEDGYIYGRGTIDMKGGLCATIMAVTFLKKMGFEPKGTILLSCDSDEENGGHLGVRHMLKKGLLKADFGVNAEASDERIIIAQSGDACFDITYFGEATYSGVFPTELNANQKAIKAINALNKYNDDLISNPDLESSDVFEFKTAPFLSVTRINGGEVYNNQPSECTFTVDRRFTSEETYESVKKEICDILDKLKQENSSMNYTINTITSASAYVLDKKNPLIQTAMKSFEQVYGKKLHANGGYGTSDSSHIVGQNGVCLPLFGPGFAFPDTGGSNERLKLEDYFKFIKIYMLMVIELLS